MKKSTPQSQALVTHSHGGCGRISTQVVLQIFVVGQGAHTSLQVVLHSFFGFGQQSALPSANSNDAFPKIGIRNFMAFFICKYLLLKIKKVLIQNWKGFAKIFLLPIRNPKGYRGGSLLG
jgi:hypothetical protein